MSTESLQVLRDIVAVVVKCTVGTVWSLLQVFERGYFVSRGLHAHLVTGIVVAVAARLACTLQVLKSVAVASAAVAFS